jgi:hypothetical protein
LPNNAKIDCEALWGSLRPVAEKMLGTYRELYPYGGFMKLNGEIAHLSAQDPHTDQPRSTDLIKTLRNSLGELAKKGDCRATAVVFDVRFKTNPSDPGKNAIQVCLDHIDGYSVNVFYIYEIVSGRCQIVAAHAQEGKYEIFGTRKQS